MSTLLRFIATVLKYVATDIYLDKNKPLLYNY